MKPIVFMLASLILFTSSAHAQQISKWTIRTYNAGAPSPLSAPVDLLAANVTCNLDPASVTVGPNPSKASWDDPVNAGKACVWTDPGTGPLTSTPFGGNYEATLTATNSAGTSAESARAPFTHPGVVPPAVTGLRLGK
jgi:hypothetical protein